MASTVTAMPARMSAEEWQTRCELAACYRLVDLFGWSDLINTRITARVPGPDDHFLINPYGLLFEEVTASSLVKIDREGNKVRTPEQKSLTEAAGSSGRAGVKIRQQMAFVGKRQGPGDEGRGALCSGSFCGSN